MRIRVLFFASAREAAGRGEAAVEVPAGARVRDLLDRISREFPAVAVQVPNLRVARNEEFAEAGDALADGDEVALLPPVGGGGSHV